MENCIFCKIIKGEIPSKKVYEDENVIGILDVSPKVNGHTLIIPKKHITDFKEMSNEDLDNVNNACKNVVPLLMDKLGSKGITIGVNYGESQAVKHYHLHLLPNFLLDDEELEDTSVIFDKITK